MSCTRAGFGAANITGWPGITLSGFIARRNQPSTGFADPLLVRCLALQDDDGPVHLLFSYDLLGIGRDLLGRLQAALAAALGRGYTEDRAVFVCSHTHSAPATVPLAGCGIPEPEYWHQVIDATVGAARQAVAGLTEAELSVARRRIAGVSYNRRRVLGDGRVTMAASPEQPVVAVGPLDDELTVLAWRDRDGKVVAAGLHFPMHPAINGTLVGTADYPGELCRLMERQLGGPCFFLQGCSGDVNPFPVATTRDEAIRCGRQIAGQLAGVAAHLCPSPTPRLGSAATTVRLDYDRRLDADGLRRELDQLAVIADWQPGTVPSEQVLRVLADIMNVEPGAAPDMAMHAHSARVLVAAGRRTLAALEDGGAPAACPLSLAVWDLGGVVLLFAAAELFAVTGLRLRESAPGRIAVPVGYGAPLVGYIPTREAVAQDGYEVEHAWRYYGHPLPFAAASEEKVRQGLAELVEKAER
ncbi:hypothetical protein HQ590_10090 [bacterium]|nr:hypothetical protein [bacterium]